MEEEPADDPGEWYPNVDVEDDDISDAGSFWDDYEGLSVEPEQEEPELVDDLIQRGERQAAYDRRAAHDLAEYERQAAYDRTAEYVQPGEPPDAGLSNDVDDVNPPLRGPARGRGAARGRGRGAARGGAAAPAGNYIPICCFYLLLTYNI